MGISRGHRHQQQRKDSDIYSIDTAFGNHTANLTIFPLIRKHPDISDSDEIFVLLQKI